MLVVSISKYDWTQISRFTFTNETGIILTQKIHPDKLGASLSPAQLLTAQRVFTVT